MLGDLAREFCDVAAFVGVYVAEAHATDEWPISSARYNAGRGAVCIPQARTQEDRDAAAASFCRDFSPAFPVVSADIAGRFEELYKPWPIRFVVVGAGRRLAFIGEPVECAPDLAALREFLLKAQAENAASAGAAAGV